MPFSRLKKKRAMGFSQGINIPGGLEIIGRGESSKPDAESSEDRGRYRLRFEIGHKGD